MKKVLFVAATLLFFAYLVHAGQPYPATSIRNTKHDLSLSSTGATAVFQNPAATNSTDQICIFCHTPHGAYKGSHPSVVGTSRFGDLLWNRNYTPDMTNFKYYSSETRKYDGTTVGFNGSSKSLYCLSCHDGTVTEVGSRVHNPSGGLDTSTSTGWSSPGMQIGTPANGDALSLTNDHPVAFTWDQTRYTDGSIFDPTSPALARWVKLFANKMECSTCHSVHNNINKKFLRTKNNGSYMCLACHNK